MSGESPGWVWFTVGVPAVALLAVLVAGGAVLAWWYAVGLGRLLARDHGRARGARRDAVRGPVRGGRHGRRAAYLLAGLGSALLVTASPLGAVLDQRLSTHMAQHVVLICVSAPLLALAAAWPTVLAGMPAPVRRRITSLRHRIPTAGLLGPHLAWALHVGALWLWHLPAAYDAAVRSPLLHIAEHTAFLGTAWLFWWHLARLGRHRLRGPAAMLYVVAAIPPGAALGAVLTFADRPLYAAQAALARAAGTDPLLDQRLGGLAMWIPLDFAYLALAVGLFAHWLRRLGRQHAASGTMLPEDARALAEDARAVPVLAGGGHR
jgi:putative membrane protein